MTMKFNESDGWSSALKMKTYGNLAILGLFSVCVASCHKVECTVVTEPEDTGQKVCATFRVASIEQVPFESFTKSTSVSEACTRMSIAAYLDGTNVTKGKQVDQEKSDTSALGNFSMYLPVGKLKVVVVGHNGDGNASLSTYPKITFSTKNVHPVTDTFCWTDSVTVTKDGSNSFQVKLSRVVTKIELHMTDSELPDDFVQLKMELKTGASRDYSYLTGYGISNSDIIEYLTEDGQTRDFGIYSFVRFDDKENTEEKMKVILTAFDANGNEMKSREFTDVPVKKNRITRISGEFFGDGYLEYSEAEFPVQANTEWEPTQEINF